MEIILPTVCYLHSSSNELSSPQNGTISEHSVPAIPGAQVTFQCDNGLFPEGIMTATCLVTGEWDKNPGEIVCRGKFIHYLKYSHASIYLEPPTAVSYNSRLSDGSRFDAAVSISVVVTAVLFTVIGLLMGLLIIICSCIRRMYTPRKLKNKLMKDPLYQLVLFMRRCHPKRRLN